jgi:nucleotide-binding universal stress UspA family protein
MKDQILCAIDFSESSIHALRWANKIALGTGAHLSVLYSYRLIQTGKVADILSFKRRMEEENRRRFAEIEQTALEGQATLRSFILEIGFYSDNIENFVRKNPSTLVVLSEELANAIYDHKGQTLLHFLKTLNVPLLIVPGFTDIPAVTEEMLDKKAITGKAY